MKAKEAQLRCDYRMAYQYECRMAKENNQNIPEDKKPCLICRYQDACEERESTSSWVYSDQFALCIKEMKPTYCDEYWWKEKERENQQNIAHNCGADSPIGPQSYDHNQRFFKPQ